jgi:5-methylthioadenosine/S-adenosylhomocysteine deaminase
MSINENFIVAPKWIYTANKNQDLLENAAVLVVGNSIKKIIPNNEINQYEVDSVYHLKDSILIPGLINNHTHAGMSFLKGYADSQPLDKWLNDYIWPAEKTYLNPDLVLDASMLSSAEMIASGVTTFNDMYFYPESTAEAIKITRQRANIGLLVMDLHTSYANDPESYLERGFEFRDNFRDEHLISTSIAPHAPYSVSNETFQIVNTYAEQLNLTIHCHLHETEWEIQESLKKFNVRPISRLNELGILGPNFIAVHCVHLDSTDLEMLNAQKVNVALCPKSNLKLGSGIYNKSLINSIEGHVTIGTDSSASNNRLDILDELKMFSLLQRSHGVEDYINHKDLIDLVTINAAKSLNLDHKIGSIEEGKAADLTVINLADVFTEPVYDPITTLIYSSGRDQVSHVWVDGRLLLKDKHFTSLDIESIQKKIKIWQSKIM